MKLNKTMHTLCIISALAFLSSCSSTPEIHNGQAGVIDSAGYPNGTTNTGVYDPSNPNSSARLPISNDTVYFKYDSIQIEPEFMPIIKTYSQYLRAHPEQNVVLEGHADERGSREYNIALGEERAKAVAKLITATGVSSRRLETISYGEEKPASYVHNDAGWHLNRRVKLIYQRNSK